MPHWEREKGVRMKKAESGRVDEGISEREGREGREAERDIMFPVSTQHPSSQSCVISRLPVCV